MSWAQKLLKLGPAALSDFKARVDSWTNAMTGLGTSRDKTTYTSPCPSPILPPMVLEAIYHDDDIAARIISALPDEAFREGFVVVSKSAAEQVSSYLDGVRSAITGGQALSLAQIQQHELQAYGIGQKAMRSEPDSVQEQCNELQAALDTFGAREKNREAMTWGRLYGLGAIYLGIDDGRDSWEPVDWENVRSVDFMTVLDKRDLTPWRWYADPQAARFGDVAVYLMQPVGVYVGAPYDLHTTQSVLLVHEERMIRYGGELTSKRLRLANQGADYSILQKCFRALQLTNDNWQSAGALLADASQGVFKIQGLIDMIAQQPDVMTQRFQFMDLARSVLRAIVLDAGDKSGAGAESFERVPSRFEGIPQMLDQTWRRLASAARMPLTVLMGMSPGGLNATGESDIRWWYDTIKATQESAVRPQVERVLRLLSTAGGYDDPGDFSIVFAPLWQMTEKEKAEMHFQQAQADNLYFGMGLSVSEILLSRFGGGKYSLETKIDTESRKRQLALELQSAEQSAQNELSVAEDPPPTPGVTAEAERQALENTPEPMPPNAVET